MSRRTKLLVTAVFLVLLAVPAVYLVLSWAPPSPLRFRVLSERVEHSGKPVKILEIEVLNTSGITPVEFEGALWGVSPGESHGEMIAFLYTDAEIDGPQYIYPHSPNRYTAVLGGEGYLADPSHLDIPIRKISVDYRWASRTKSWVMKARNHLCMLLPPGVEDYIPAPTAKVEYAPLETTP
jgi:hypothetical protein